MRMAQFFELCKIALGRDVSEHCLGDDGSDLSLVAGEERLNLRQITVLECVHIAACLVEDPALPHALRSGCPLVPAVVVAAQDMLAPRIGACDTDGRLGCLRTGLEEAHHLRARDMLDTEACIRHLLGRHKGESHPAPHLPHDRIVNRLVAVAEQHGTEPHVVVDVLVAVYIPDMRILSPLDVDRGDTLHMGLRAFAVQLTAG